VAAFEDNQETEGAMTMTNFNLAAADERLDTPPTHTMYTPIWEPDGGKFRKWLGSHHARSARTDDQDIGWIEKRHWTI
jgi:hypothetical protein